MSTTSDGPGASGASGPWVVVGLGNPGPAYAGNRHNVGHLVLEELVTRMGGRLRRHRSARADVLEGRLGIGGPRLVLGRPRCYMNESGPPVARLLAFYSVASARLVVVHDELDLPFEGMRLKFGGGDNGHNGLKSLRSALGTGDYHRVRVGIGRPPGRQSAADFVLSDFSAGERPLLGSVRSRAADGIEALVDSGLTTAQSRFNT